MGHIRIWHYFSLVTKQLKYFTDFYNWHLSISLRKWALTIKVKWNQTRHVQIWQDFSLLNIDSSNEAVNSIWENWTHYCNSWSLYITEYCFPRIITLNTQHHLKEDLLVLSCCFTFSYLIIFFFIISFQTLIHKETSRL